jgi:hypothetical protein
VYDSAADLMQKIFITRRKCSGVQGVSTFLVGAIVRSAVYERQRTNVEDTYVRQQRNPDCAQAIDFRGFVKDCAQKPEFVEYFNRACGANLQAPITSLLDDNWPLQASEEEQLMIGCFIVFVHENIWVRLKTAADRTGLRLALET